MVGSWPSPARLLSEHTVDDRDDVAE